MWAIDAAVATTRLPTRTTGGGSARSGSEQSVERRCCADGVQARQRPQVRLGEGPSLGQVSEQHGVLDEDRRLVVLFGDLAERRDFVEPYLRTLADLHSVGAAGTARRSPVARPGVRTERRSREST